MNALSEVLQAVKLTGAVFLDAEFRAPPARWRRHDGAAAPLPPR